MNTKSKEGNFKRKWFFISTFLLFIGLLNFGIVITNEFIYDDSIDLIYPFVNEMTGSLTIIFLIGAILYLFEKFPIKKNNLVYSLPLHLVFSIIYGASHTTLMTISRKVIYYLFNLGGYNPGELLFRYLMEYQKQFITYWMIYTIYWLFKTIRENQKQRVKALELEQQLTTAKLDALKMQLNPHFLFNTLNVISSTMYDAPKEADKMIADLSDLLRVTLNSKELKEHTLEKELEITDLYIDIMKARFKDKLVIEKDIAKDSLNTMVPHFILQPLIENSIRYGVESIKQANIKINTKIEGDILKIIIEDNGPGITDENEKVLSRGIGLSNTYKRLENLYGEKYLFQLNNLPKGGLQVIIQIPIKYSMEPELQ